MHRLWQLTAIACVACVQKPPHATVVVSSDGRPTSHAVLVMPTRCVALGDDYVCRPSAYGSKHVTSRSFATYVDPALRLKLEFAGFTLAEAGAMRLETADRIDGVRRPPEPEAPRTVADLPMSEVHLVATSLGLTSVLVPTLTIRPARHGMWRGELRVTLVDVATDLPRWTVTCEEILFSPDETPNRLANCAGNGVLAALAPENLVGRAL